MGTLTPGLQGNLWDLGQPSPGQGRRLLPEDHQGEWPFPRQCRHGLPFAEGRVGVEAHFRAWHHCGTQQALSRGWDPMTVRSAVWPGVFLAVLLRSCPRKEQMPLAPSLRASLGKLPWPLPPSISTPPANKGVPSLRALVVSGTLLLFLLTSECPS